MHGAIPRTNNHKNLKVLQISPNRKRETNILQKYNINLEKEKGAGAAFFITQISFYPTLVSQHAKSQLQYSQHSSIVNSNQLPYLLL